MGLLVEPISVIKRRVVSKKEIINGIECLIKYKITSKYKIEKEYDPTDFEWKDVFVLVEKEEVKLK